jgi:hypothetical protein
MSEFKLVISPSSLDFLRLSLNIVVGAAPAFPETGLPDIKLCVGLLSLMHLKQRKNSLIIKCVHLSTLPVHLCWQRNDSHFGVADKAALIVSVVCRVVPRMAEQVWPPRAHHPLTVAARGKMAN